MDNDKHNRMRRLAEENLDYLFRFAYFRLGDRDDAEDAVQEAFVRFFGKAGTVKPEKARMYLFRTLHNLCNSWHGRVRHLSLEVIKDQPTNDEDRELRDEFLRIERLLCQLPQSQQEVILMHTVDALSFVEIAEILEQPESTLKSRYQSGMEKLKNLLKH